MKSTTLLMVLAVLSFGLNAFTISKPEPDWSKLCSFRMYAVSFVKPVGRITNKELDSAVFIDVPITEAREMFVGRVRLTKKALLYQTMVFCVLKFKGGPDRRFIISSHNGFFTDLYANRLYEVFPEHLDDWEKFISKYEKALIRKDYMRQYPNEDTTDIYRGDINN